MKCIKKLFFLILLAFFAISIPKCSPEGGSPPLPPAQFCAVSQRAYTSGTAMNGAQATDANLADAQNLDWDNATSGINSTALNFRSDQNKDFDILDWNTALLAGRELSGDPNGFLDFADYFLVYQVSYSPSGGAATVEISVHRGRPYNPQSTPILTVSGTAAIGDNVTLNTGDPLTITSASNAILFAAIHAAQALIAEGVFDFPSIP